MGRFLAIAMVLSGCGRLGFDGVNGDPGDEPPNPAAPVGPGSLQPTENLTPQVCSTRTIPTALMGSDAQDLSVVATPTGATLIAACAGSGNLMGLEVDHAFAATGAPKIIRAGAFTKSMASYVDSTLIANNTYGSTEYDLSVPKRSSTMVTFSGSNNLVRVTFAAVPPDTIKLSCPLLGPLRNNGGLTRTHAMLSKSPGLDQGNNTLNLSTDQRGSGFARVSGAAADIGAYEVQQNDIVFNNGFDGCPQLF